MGDDIMFLITQSLDSEYNICLSFHLKFKFLLNINMCVLLDILLNNTRFTQ